MIYEDFIGFLVTVRSDLGLGRLVGVFFKMMKMQVCFDKRMPLEMIICYLESIKKLK